MSVITTLVTPPASEPIALSTAKLHLRVDGVTEDALIATYIAAARQYVEERTGRSMLPTTWRDLRSGFETSMTLARAPVISVSHVKHLDSTLTLQTVSALDYRAILAGGPAGGFGFLDLTAGSNWPSTWAQADAVQIEYVAGYADAASVPPSLIAAILLVLGDLYTNRAALVEGSLLIVNPTVDALISPHRLIWV